MKQTKKLIAAAAAVLALCLLFSACAMGGNVHEVKNAKGIVLCTDDAIDTSATKAQNKIEEYMKANDADDLKKNMSGPFADVDIFASGNAMVVTLSMKTDLNEEEPSVAQESFLSMAKAIDVKEGRAETGVDDLVVVYAVISKDGKVLSSDILK